MYGCHERLKNQTRYPSGPLKGYFREGEEPGRINPNTSKNREGIKLTSLSSFICRLVGILLRTRRGSEGFGSLLSAFLSRSVACIGSYIPFRFN